jgi:putative ABC transport system permease protein
MSLEQELSKYPGVSSVTHGIAWPGRPGTGLYFFEGKEGTEEHNFYVLFGGLNYLDTLGIELIEGRDFDAQHSSDISSSVLVNETLVQELGWEEPIGKRIYHGRNLDAQVIGVVKDFNYRSLHNKIEPLIIRLQPGFNNTFIILRINGENIIETMAALEKKWKEINPNRPFEYQFLDQDFGRLYEADQRQNSLVQLFSYICLFISLLGLLGLSSFNAVRRTKEIAIRKVCGASAPRIVVKLFREIFIMIVIAAAVVLPLSFFLINVWLQNFAYRTDINIFLFVEAVGAILLVAFLTASYHCIKVAGSNPVNSLRYE